MTVLLILTMLLVGAQMLCARQARRAADHLMRPACDWDDDDVDCWLGLIEPFPLPDHPSESHS